MRLKNYIRLCVSILAVYFGFPIVALAIPNIILPFKYFEGDNVIIAQFIICFGSILTLAPTLFFLAWLDKRFGDNRFLKWVNWHTVPSVQEKEARELDKRVECIAYLIKKDHIIDDFCLLCYQLSSTNMIDGKHHGYVVVYDKTANFNSTAPFEEWPFIEAEDAARFFMQKHRELKL